MTYEFWAAVGVVVLIVGAVIGSTTGCVAGSMMLGWALGRLERG